MKLEALVEHVADELLESGSDQIPAANVGAKIEAGDGMVRYDQPLHVDVRRLPARLAIDHHATEGSERQQGPRQRHPASHLEEQIRTATTGQATNRSRPAWIGVVDGL